MRFVVAIYLTLVLLTMGCQTAPSFDPCISTVDTGVIRILYLEKRVAELSKENLELSNKIVHLNDRD